MEAIIGGGEYSDLNIYDNLPLGIKNGYLYNKGANLQAPVKLNTQWQHVAISCDGKSITIYVEGKEVARADTAFAILPVQKKPYQYVEFGNLSFPLKNYSHKSNQVCLF